MANVTAIIGLAGRFPGEPTAKAFWRHLSRSSDGAEPASGESAPEPWMSRARLLHDAATQAAAATALDPDRTGLFAGSDEGDTLAADVAGEMGLRGPVVTVSTTSHALAAVERACESLGSGECDLALAAEAPAGGGLVGVLALKRLPQAVADGDSLLGLIRAGELEPSPAPLPQAGRDLGEAPEPVRERPALANAYMPPANPLEAAIAGVWQEQLGVDRVGVDDNFFELGGTSILGVRIIAVLKDWLHQDIPTVSLYEGPTVSALSKVLLQGGRSKGYDAVRERGERRRRKLQRLGHGAQDSAE